MHTRTSTLSHQCMKLSRGVRLTPTFHSPACLQLSACAHGCLLEVIEEADSVLECINESVHFSMCVVDVGAGTCRGVDVQVAVQRLQEDTDRQKVRGSALVVCDAVCEHLLGRALVVQVMLMIMLSLQGSAQVAGGRGACQVSHCMPPTQSKVEPHAAVDDSV